MRFQHWFGRDRERELDDEFRDHIEREIAENIARGLTPAEARRQALLAFEPNG